MSLWNTHPIRKAGQADHGQAAPQLTLEPRRRPSAGSMGTLPLASAETPVPSLLLSLKAQILRDHWPSWGLGLSARRTGLQEIKERDEDCSPHKRAVPSNETAAWLPHRMGGDETAARLPHRMVGRKVTHTSLWGPWSRRVQEGHTDPDPRQHLPARRPQTWAREAEAHRWQGAVRSPPQAQAPADGAARQFQ